MDFSSPIFRLRKKCVIERDIRRG